MKFCQFQGWKPQKTNAIYTDRNNFFVSFVDIKSENHCALGGLFLYDLLS